MQDHEGYDASGTARPGGGKATPSVSPSGFSIAEVAREVGVSPPTLRVWEREGLVSPPRTERGYRVYREGDVERLKEVRRLRALKGYNLPAIREKLGPASPPDGTTNGGGEGPALAVLGDRLRQLRTRARKTLKEVAAATRLSVSFISQLERGESGASVSSLHRLAEFYGVTVREIFGADLEGSSFLVRKEEKQVIDWGNGVRIEELAVGRTTMDPTLVHVPPGAGSEGFYSHTGEEFIHVLEGALLVELKGRDTFRLEEGDTLYFPSTIPHRWWAGDEPARLVYVNTPPTF